MAKRPRYRIREDGVERIEVHVGSFCFRRKGKTLELLVGKRLATRHLFPSLWECGGGQVRVNESFEEAIQRQIAEEFGVEVRVLMVFTTYAIHAPNNTKIPGLKFICQVAHGDDEFTFNPREFSEAAWVTKSKCRSLRMIGGVQQDAMRAFDVAERYLAGPTTKKKKPGIGFRES